MRKRKVRSITVIGRNWFRRGAGGNYLTAEILVNGEHVHKTEIVGGSGSYYEQVAGEWLDKAGYLPGIKRYQSGGIEPLWSYCEARKISYTRTATDVSRERDL